MPQKQGLAEAMRYALLRWAALSAYIGDGRVEIDNNIAETARNWRIANILTIIETVKLQGHNPEVYLTAVLTRCRIIPKIELNTWCRGFGHQQTLDTRPRMARLRFIYTLRQVAGMIGENLELIEEVTAMK